VFEPASTEDEARLASLARSLAPPRARVDVLWTYHRTNGPLARASAEYYVNVTPAYLRTFYERLFRKRGWVPCEKTIFDPKDVDAYRDGYNVARIEIPDVNEVRTYTIDLEWSIPNSC